MICGAEIPRAWERFWIVTPDSTVTGPVGCDSLLRARLSRTGAALTRSPDVAAAGGAALDDDTSLPPTGPTAGPDRAIWLVRAVCHQIPISMCLPVFEVPVLETPISELPIPEVPV